MIKLGILRIEEFRGIRELEINFNYESFAVHGPNGSGKSGVVDAIGFVFSGTVARLTGVGTRSVSVRTHAPHVKSKDDPGAAKVSLTFKDLKSGEIGTITRTVVDPANFKLSPDTPALRVAIQDALEHPEITLSRREIIRFILAESGKRSEEVQALLQLDKIESNRKILKNAQNKVIQIKKNASEHVSAAQKQIELHLEIEGVNSKNITNAVNPHRKILGLDEFDEVNLSTNLKEGLDEKDDEKTFDKISAKKDLDAYKESYELPTTMLESAVEGLLKSLVDVKEGGELDLLKDRNFLETGLELIAEDGNCPLCDTAWNTPEELRVHLTHKIEGSKELDRIDKNISSKAAILKTELNTERALLGQCQKLSVIWSSAEDQVLIQERMNLLVEFGSLMKDSKGCIDIKERLEASELKINSDLKSAIGRLEEKIKSQPDTSVKSRSQSHLVIAAERWSIFANAKSKEHTANLSSERAKQVYETYCKVADNDLDILYKTVETRFSEFYSYINDTDEGAFKAEFKPAAGKLDLFVDFYGLGQFPPGAYHSEGHQDGMGICLYLSLVEKILGEGFTLSVLDDVVMSVDVNHRRQFCELLRKEFPNTQFIITTHDEIWAKQMKTTGLIKSKSDIRFRGWSVDHGPIYEQGQVFWDKISLDLQNDDVPSASHKLRRGLEAELPDIAEALNAKVIFRGDAKYELGELQDSITSRHAGLLKNANESANSWGNKVLIERIKQLNEERSKVALTQQRENWAVNLTVHFNEWADMSANDFKPVVKAWRAYLDLFKCTNIECDSWIFVTYDNGNAESLRCRCGEINLNLLKK